MYKLQRGAQCISLPDQAEIQKGREKAEEGGQALVEAVSADAEVIMGCQAIEEVAQDYSCFLGSVFFLGLEQLVAVQSQPANALQKVAIRYPLPQHRQSFPPSYHSHLNQIREHITAIFQQQQRPKCHHEPINAIHLFLLPQFHIIPHHQAKTVKPQQSSQVPYLDAYSFSGLEVAGEGEAACSFDEVGAEADQLDRKVSTLSAEKVPALTLRRIRYCWLAVSRMYGRKVRVITCGLEGEVAKLGAIQRYGCFSRGSAIFNMIYQANPTGMTILRHATYKQTTYSLPIKGHPWHSFLCRLLV